MASVTDLRCQYSLLCALREAGFSNSRIYKCLDCLFDEPEPKLASQDAEPTDEAPLPEPPPYESSEEDLAELAQWSASRDRQRLRDEEFVEMQAICDMIEAMEDERRYTDQDLERSAGLPVG